MLHARAWTRDAPRDRAPVVLVHGLGMSGRYMIPLARVLAPHMPVYAPDLPGFGDSAAPPCILDVPQMAAALAGFLEAAALPRAAFVGNSLGCEVLVALAAAEPERIGRLVLQGPTPDPRDRSTLQKLALFPVTALFERPQLFWVALADYLRTGPWRFARTFKAMTANRIEPQLPRVRAPTLVVRGSRDLMVPRRAVERYARLLPRGDWIVVAGAAHGMNFSHPERLAAAILPFLLAPPDGG